MKIGVLALQGGVVEHIDHIKAIGEEAVEIKKLDDLDDIDGIILPGGESTAIGKLLRERDMLIPLRDKIEKGLPVWGTCAGMVILARCIENDDAMHLGVMDIKVRRNAYGSQLASFKTYGVIGEVSDKKIPMIFIRAPYILETGRNVKILSKVDGSIVAARQDNILATSFHPELSDDTSFHKYFIEICRGKKVENIG